MVQIPTKAEREERQRRVQAEARRLLAEQAAAQKAAEHPFADVVPFVPPTPEEIQADEARIAAEERALEEARERERFERDYEAPVFAQDVEPDWDAIAVQFAARAGDA